MAVCWTCGVFLLFVAIVVAVNWGRCPHGPVELDNMFMLCSMLIGGAAIPAILALAGVL